MAFGWVALVPLRTRTQVMMYTHRRLHRRLWIALALILPLLFLAAVGLRPQPAIESKVFPLDSEQ